MPTKLLTEKEQKKLDDWNRIFPPRVHKAIYHIKLLDNCSNKRNYLWPKNLAKRYFLLLAAIVPGRVVTPFPLPPLVFLPARSAEIIPPITREV